MTTGRINQVATRTRGFIAAKDRSFIKLLAGELLESVFSVSLLCYHLNLRSHSVSPEIKSPEAASKQ